MSVERDEKGRWLPGSGSPNPAGHPVGTKKVIAKAFLEAMHKKWLERGEEALDRMIDEEPGGFVRAMVALMPKDTALVVEDADGTPLGIQVTFVQPAHGAASELPN